MAIRTDFDSFGTLMESAVLREVPLYQRRYSWGRQQIEALWDDILRLYKARQDKAPIKHFIGPLILGEPRSRGLRPGVTQIIDGQQRLMTLSLLIVAARDLLLWESDDYDIVTEKYLTISHGKDDPEPRVQPGRWDRDAYLEAVFATAQEFTEPSAPVARAYDWIVDLLYRGPGSEDEVEQEDDGFVEPDGSVESDAPEGSIEGLDDETAVTDNDPRELWDAACLLGAVAEDLELAIVSDVPEARAYEIFATINATGLRLSQVDLIRNMIFVNLPTRAAELFESLWQPMEDTLGVKGLDAYLHCWVMARGYNVSKKNTYSALVEMLKGNGASEHTVESILRQVYADCGHYILAAMPDDDEALAAFEVKKVPKSLHEALRRLEVWGSIPLEPVLFLIAKRWKTESITTVQAAQLCGAIESLVVRRYICQIPPNDLRSSFARLAGQIAALDGEAFVQGVMEELNDPGRRWPTDKEVRDACVGAPLYRKKPQQCFYVLERIATKLEGKEAPAFELGVGLWTIEHLMPQSLPKAWRDDLISWNYSDPTALYQQFGNTLGNLTITRFNSDISNLPFELKRVKLTDKNHKLELTSTFLTATEWGEREIVKRAKALSEVVITLWPKP